jgi:hypothetical protein
LNFFEKHTENEKDLYQINGHIEIDLPNNNIYSIDGTLFDNTGSKVNFNNNHVLLRVK